MQWQNKRDLFSLFKKHTSREIKSFFSKNFIYKECKKHYQKKKKKEKKEKKKQQKKNNQLTKFNKMTDLV